MAAKVREFVCERCFQDERLREWIRTEGHLGPCSFCRARKARRVPLGSLAEIFREAVTLYSPTDSYNGELISYLLQHDWDVFSEKLYDAPGDLPQEMTVDILEAGLHPKDDDYHGEYRGLFVSDDFRLEDTWVERIEDLIAGRAQGTPKESPFGPPMEVPDDLGPDPIEFAVEDMAQTYEADRLLFRARIHKDRARSTMLSREELGAPPHERARAGRANRSGQAVLYMASDAKTALAEVRAWKGAAIAVATMKLARSVQILDLSGPLNVESPFFDDHIEWTCQVNGLFRRFAEELSRPVIPGEEETLYVPSQEVCEVVRAAGLHGIAYPSAMGYGHNVVLFDPNAASATEIEYVRVTSIDCAYKGLERSERPYEDWPYQVIAPGRHEGTREG